MSLTRRALLGGLAASPVAVPAAAQYAARKINMAEEVAMKGLAARSGSLGIPLQPRVFKSFGDWWAECHDGAWERARHVAVLDPDIQLLRLPLTTQVRMQRLRNYNREKDAQENHFMSVLSRAGKFEWY